ncbi:polysaccharide pyruvyl transferase family protein [Flavobacterium sp. NST-5]|uniref:Polysaccharide pyruvyl transferase family protein n=1 Tax=Flavobacterium ichthyis TaxID=2698827 RepID=A0ABW9Z7I0_9FLAO|nr:polysaccharide pyruvyl transferase family protein [Flavobacterium ichthyis]NBL64836.1 polysaccharide pyruvyl transferase family protein [Flavobacterium ichthyis]
MFKDHKIKLFWWSEIYLGHKDKENFGDLVGKYLVEKISNKPVKWLHPKKRGLFSKNTNLYFTAGSILSQVNGKCTVWGSGIITKDHPVKPAIFTAVRGPQTRKHLISQGYNVPEIYGDPALLLPLYHNPKIDKKYKVGIIPHYVDYKTICNLYANSPHIKVIDLMTNNVESVCNEILECENIISSSLHGVIVPHAYGIPAVYVKFSDKIFGDGIKYQDYFESIEIDNYAPKYIQEIVTETAWLQLISDYNSLPKAQKINQLQKGLLAACPFK